MLDQVRDAYLLMDNAFRIVAVNPSAERILGRPGADPVGQTHWAAFPASVGAEPERKYRRVAAERVEAHFVHHYVGEGYDVHLEIDAYAAPIVGPDGTILGAVVVLTDTSRVRAAAAEREQLLAERDGERTLLRAVLDQMPAAVFIAEAPSGRVLALNDAVARVWGEPRPHTDAIGHYQPYAIHPAVLTR